MELLGYLVEPVCPAGAQYPVFLLVIDPSLRDYILLSHTFPSRLPPLPPGSAGWSLANLTDPAALHTRLAAPTLGYGAQVGVRWVEAMNPLLRSPPA